MQAKLKEIPIENVRLLPGMIKERFEQREYMMSLRIKTCCKPLFGSRTLGIIRNRRIATGDGNHPPAS